MKTVFYLNASIEVKELHRVMVEAETKEEAIEKVKNGLCEFIDYVDGEHQTAYKPTCFVEKQIINDKDEIVEAESMDYEDIEEE